MRAFVTAFLSLLFSAVALAADGTSQLIPFDGTAVVLRLQGDTARELWNFMGTSQVTESRHCDRVQGQARILDAIICVQRSEERYACFKYIDTRGPSSFELLYREACVPPDGPGGGAGVWN